MTESPIFICYNGDIIPSKPIISIQSSTLKNGEGLYEVMRTWGTRILFFDLHYNRLRESMKILNMNVESLPSKTEIENSVSRLLYRNKYLIAAKLQLTLFYPSEQITNHTNNIDYTIEPNPIGNGKYESNAKGAIIDLYKPNLLYPTTLTSLKSTSRLLNSVAARYAHANRLNDCIILNNNKKIVGATASNIFIYKNETLFTPPLADGCINGIMRSQIIDIACENGIEVCTTTSLTESDLADAKEVFLTNTVKGVEWVIAYRNCRYFSRLAKTITRLLNRKVGMDS